MFSTYGHIYELQYGSSFDEPGEIGLSVVQPSDHILHIQFSRSIDDDPGSVSIVENAGSWSVETTGFGVPPVVYSAALISASTVELGISYSTDGETFTLMFAGGAFDTNGRRISKSSTNYVADVSKPRIVSALAKTDRTVEVEFDRDILRNAALFNVANYEVSGTTVAKVQRTSPTRITLTTGTLVGTVLTVRVLP